MTLHNGFHGTSVNIRIPANGVLTAGQYKRAMKKLCGLADCKCASSQASGPDTGWLAGAEPIYGDNGKIIKWALGRSPYDFEGN